MGVSIYVMPLTRYLTGRFKTTWENRSETAGGVPGFRLTGRGIEAPPESSRLSPAEAVAWVDRLKASLRERYVEPEWLEEGEVLHAGTLSYSSFASVSDLAGRYAGRARFIHMADPLCPFWLPARFPRPLRLRDPAGGDDPITVLSSVEAREEITRLAAFHQEDSRAREIESLPNGSVIRGSLADYEGERRVLRHVLDAATLSVERRVPLIIEG